MKTIFKAIVGSQSYGTAIPTSDIDYKGVYIQDADELLGFGYKEQVEVGKDECCYEVRRFLQLLQSANPTMLELLYTPKDCIVIKQPQFNLIIDQRDKFLTKKCQYSFGGYAIAQIQKARGLNKKMNWENSKVIRKTPLDFTYAQVGGGTVPIIKYLEDRLFNQEQCGLVALDHFKDCYALYYDYTGKLGFRGLVIDDGNSLRLSSIPKSTFPKCIIYYNKDGYSMHCNEYKEYQIWLENRNEQRYVDVKGHDQKIDGKNLMHCRRLLDMAIEIAIEGTINVRRPNKEYLLKIRRGEVSLDQIIDEADKDIDKLKELFNKSSLPYGVDLKFVNDLLLEVRHY